MNDDNKPEHNAPASRATHLPQPRLKPRVAFWFVMGILFVGSASFVLMFAVTASRNNWW